MKLVSKMAAFGATAALSATGLVAASGTTATAATVTPNYTCTFTIPDGSGGTQQEPLTIPITATFPAGPLTQGTTVPAGAPIGATLDLANPSADTAANQGAIDTALIGALGVDGTIGGSATYNAASSISIGSVPVAASIAAPQSGLIDVGTSGLTGTGTLGSFTPAGSGTENITLPAKFGLHVVGVTGSSSTAGGGHTVDFGNVPCASTTGQRVVVGHIAVKPKLATLNVKAPKKVKAGHVLKLKVTTTENGKAVAKIKGKKVAKAKVKKNGKATLKIKKGLKKGKNKIVVSVGSLKKHVKVKVK